MAWNHFIGMSKRPSKESRSQTTALIGWKRNELAIDNNGRLKLKPLAFSKLVSLDTDAKCEAKWEMESVATNPNITGLERFLANKWLAKHTIVGKLCSCGFYAYDSREAAEGHNQPSTDKRESVLLEVAISGKFMQYQKGYRFAHQRVKRIIVDSCSSYGCLEQATLFSLFEVEGRSDQLLPVCEDHLSYTLTRRVSFAEVNKRIEAQSRGSRFPLVKLETANGDEPWVPNIVEKVARKASWIEEWGMLIPIVAIAGGIIPFMNWLMSP